jgi:N,N'-diacetyllegionaminate synthase
MKTLIIAEAGVNHNGDIEKAKQLIHAAKYAGADIVKFQTFKSGNLVGKNADKASYQKLTTGSNERQYEMLRKLEISESEHNILVNECQEVGIEFLSTAFDAESFDMLLEIGIKLVKISSGEMTNLPLIRHMTRLNLPVILSTGMANLGDIEATIDVIERVGTSRSNITLLHCTTEYPAPINEVNLRAMVNMKNAFGICVGYSDHTLGIEVPIAAVALGARVLEKHITLDRNLPGPDHHASLEPEEFRSMVNAIRNIEVALGDGIKRPSETELKNKPIARKSLVAIRPIREGECFSAENIGAKRPGFGISPMRWDEVIGRSATRDYLVDQVIEL